MTSRLFETSLIAAALCVPCQAQEDFSINWHTVDCGGGSSIGQEFSVVATIAQPDAGSMYGGESGEGFAITGGFWALEPTGSCYANCDGSTAAQVLTANDFQCFLNAFAAGLSYANCDASTGEPALTANDFQCYLNAFAAGCT